MLWLLAVPVGVARAESSAEAPEAAAPDLTEVKSIYDRGKAKFDTFDYGGAVELWTQAYALLGDTAEERQIKNALVYNIATAQERAYEIEHDVARLRQATALLRKYVEEYKALYQATPEGRAEVQRVETRIAELELRIGQAESEGAPPAAATEAEPATPAPRRTNLERERKLAVRELLRNDPDIAPRYRAGRGMIIGGSVALGVGAVMFLGFISAVATYPGDYDDLSRWRRNAWIGVGTVSSALVVGGAVLLGLGIPMRQRASRDANAKVAWTPVLTPTGAGMRFVARF